MTPGTLAYVDPVTETLDPSGAPARVVETTTRHREGARPEHAALVDLVSDPPPAARRRRFWVLL